MLITVGTLRLWLLIGWMHVQSILNVSNFTSSNNNETYSRQQRRQIFDQQHSVITPSKTNIKTNETRPLDWGTDVTMEWSDVPTTHKGPFKSPQLNQIDTEYVTSSSKQLQAVVTIHIIELN